SDKRGAGPARVGRLLRGDRESGPHDIPDPAGVGHSPAHVLPRPGAKLAVVNKCQALIEREPSRSMVQPLMAESVSAGKAAHGPANPAPAGKASPIETRLNQ